MKKKNDSYKIVIYSVAAVVIMMITCIILLVIQMFEEEKQYAKEEEKYNVKHTENMKTITPLIQSFVQKRVCASITVKPITIRKKRKIVCQEGSTYAHVSACACSASCGSNFSRNGKCSCYTSCGSNYS